jgi:hypothetical protein
MDLLRLHPTILAYLRSLPPGTSTRMVTERALRTVVLLQSRQQVQAAKRSVRGFQDFIDREAERVA